MPSLTITKQIWFAFILLLTGLCCVSAVAFYGSNKLAHNGSELANSALPSLRYSMKMRSDMNDLRVSQLYHILFQTPEEMTSELGWWNKKADWVTESRKTYGELARTDAEREILKKFDAAWAGYMQTIPDLIMLSSKGQKREAFIADRNTLTPLLDAAKDESVELVELAQKRADELSAETALLEQSVNTAITIIVALAIILAGITIVVLTRAVAKSIASIIVPMKRLAKGDLDAEIPHCGRKTEVGAIADAVLVFKEGLLERRELERQADRFKDDLDRKLKETEAAFELAGRDQATAVEALAYGLTQLSSGNVAYQIVTPFSPSLDQLRIDFNTSLANLNTALSSVGRVANGIDSGSKEIQSAADDLSRRTEQQAASVEETAAALEEITMTVKDSSRRAQEAGKLVARTHVGAEQSGQVVNNAVLAMEGIQKSSGEINSIIGVIDEIAFQTNLLALNAGVEAARAGDAGKGFAVVAQEVRELAQRSAKAAKEIKSLINMSSEEVHKGVQLVGATGTSLEKIVGEMSEINQHVSSIVESAREQAVALQEINTAVNTMDQGTQQNAAMVEQTTAASHGLAREAEELKQLLAHFTLSDDLQHSRPRSVSKTNASTASPARALTQQVEETFASSATLAKVS